MNCYLFVTCKNRKCRKRILLTHHEVPNQTVTIDYPDEWFPVTVMCPDCEETDCYEAAEVQERASHALLHRREWRPILMHPEPRMTLLPSSERANENGLRRLLGFKAKHDRRT